MTALLMYEAILIEMRKENAPNILLEDFNYFANKAISLYINKRYNIYDINQQTTDDLRVLKATALLTVEASDDYKDLGLGATYSVKLPADYLHMLNCICIYNVKKTYKCYNAGDTFRAAATRLTADAFSLVLDNFWNRPTYKRPYYYIHNVNDNINHPTNSETDKGVKPTHTVRKFEVESSGSILEIEGERSLGFDAYGNNIVESDGFSTSINLNSLVERGAGIRYGDIRPVRLEIRYGSDNSLFKLKQVYIDYIKSPQYIRLTQDQLDLTEDTSQMLEFPDYVCQEIVNELVHIIMENISDLRLLTHPVVSLSIANPAQQLTEPVALST